MFLERLGQLFFLKMRPLFFFLLLAIPLIGAGFILYQKRAQFQNLEIRFESAAQKERLASERKERKERFLMRYSHPNPYFLDQEIESRPFLETERQRLESLSHHPAFPDSAAIQERLAWIKENRLTFSEEGMEASPLFKEVREKQRRPVQMDETDLKKILSLIEDIPIDEGESFDHRPQLLIQEFRLKKQETALHTEVFEVEMDLIKREFAQP